MESCLFVLLYLNTDVLIVENQAEFCLVISNCPDHAVAVKIADTLVERELAACVNILPEIKSIYKWKGKLERDAEHMLLIKTEKTRYDAVQEAILAMHPYELPEIIAVPIAKGLPDYLAWVSNSINKKD